MKTVFFHSTKANKLIFLISVSIFICFYTAKPQSNDDCLACHSDPTITMDRNGKTTSLTVKKFTLARSPHRNLKCIQCHVGFDPNNIPHKAKIEPINCMSCHNNVASIHVFHPQMKKATGVETTPIMNCKGCHGTHNIIAPEEPGSKFYFTNLTEACGSCHKKEKEQHTKSGHYFAYKRNEPNVPTCIFCHSKPITQTYQPDLAKLKQTQIDLCLSCHLNNPSVQSPYAISLINFEKSVHGAAILSGKKEAAGCVDCHGVHDLEKANNPTSRINQFNVPNVCGKCHVSIAQEYQASVHGAALQKGIKDAPGCSYCHGEHNISRLPDVPKRVFEETHMKHSTIVRNKMVFCVACHANKEMMQKYNILTVSEAHDWLPNKEKHWERVRCVDCHSSYVPPNLSHNILPPEKTIKKCEECHNQNSVLMTKLYKHEKQQSREKFGFINGTLLSDAYVIGTTRNVFLDTLSIFGFGIVILGIFFHGMLRWYFNRGVKK